MSKVDAFKELPTVVCRLYSNDHAPPHFHVKSRDGVWEVRIRFLSAREQMVQVKWGHPRKSQLEQLLDRAEDHRVALLEEWERKVCRNE